MTPLRPLRALRSAWRWLRAGPGAYPFALVGALGIAVGVIGWGGFNTAMEATNTLGFCVSCHEMRSTVFEEYKTTAHFRNASGVRAICSDCHVPRDWTHKLVRKVEASAELWHKVIGSIDTPEKFEARRLDLARHEWQRMRASDSRECRNCHAFEAMDFHRQRPKSAEAMRPVAEKGGKTCIDCHKGIAHKLPDMAARHRAQFAALTGAAATLDPAVGAGLLTLASAPFFLERPEGEVGRAGDGTLFAATPVTVIARDGAWLHVEARLWQRRTSKSNLFARALQRIPAGTLTPAAAARVEPLGTVTDPVSDEVWTEGRLRVWTSRDRLTADSAALWRYGAELYDSSCSFCHALPKPADYDANAWIGHLNAMKRFVDLDEGQFGFLQKYVQLQARGSPGLPR